MMNGISLDQLHTFIAAADEGSFSAAARRLKRVQSFVSETVSYLEVQLGVRLFDRSARYPVLTDQGRALLANARTVTRQMDLLKARAKGLASGCEADLSVVVDPLFPIAMLTEAMTALQDQFPDTSLRLHLETWGAVAQHVLDRRSVVGAMSSLIATPPQLARERLMTVKLAMVVAPQHPLAGHRGPIPTEAFTNYIQAIDIDPAKLPPNYRSAVLSPKTWLLAHAGAKLAFLRAGFGFGILPLHMMERDLESGALVQIRSENSPLCGYEAEVSVLYRKDNPPGLAARWLIDRLAQEEAPQLEKGARGRSSTFTAKPKSSRIRSRRSTDRSRRP